MTILISGINGQDGTILASKYFKKGIPVIGISSNLVKASNTYKRELKNGLLTILTFSEITTESIMRIIEKRKIRAIFNFASFATGSGMYLYPENILKVNGFFPIKILEALRLLDNQDCSFIQASSSEMYGNTSVGIITESSPMNPTSPYGASKLLAHNYCSIYRQYFNLKSSSAILFNHESIYRPDAFVTTKISKSAALAKLGKLDLLELGDLNAQRDWGCAFEFMHALELMSESTIANDYIIATGSLSSVEDLCNWCFTALDLDYRDYVKSSSKSDSRVEYSKSRLGSNIKIRENLGWRPEKNARNVLEEMTLHFYNTYK